MISNTTIQFLKNLKQNNNKEWFDKNRTIYESAKLELKDLFADIKSELIVFDKSIAPLELKNSLFRINKDIRFSKDKTPYKTNIGLYLNAFGKNAMNAGYYLHIEPNNCFIAGGLYQADAPTLAKIRQEIDYNFNDFKSIITNKNFVKYFGNLSNENKLVNPPKGYTSDNAAIEYLKLKSFIVIHHCSDADVCSKSFGKYFGKIATQMFPLIQFINTAVSPE